MQRIVTLVETNLRMELNRLTPALDVQIGLNTQRWMPPPKGCLKLNMVAGFKDNSAAFAVLARDERGKVQGLWFERAHFNSMLEAEAKAIFNACAVVKDKNYYKIIIESDCKILVDAIMGYVSCPWNVSAKVEDVKLFLEDFPHVSVPWISRLGNLVAHESAQWMYNVIRSGSSSISKVPSTVDVICIHERSLF